MRNIPGLSHKDETLYAGVMARLAAYTIDCMLLVGGLLVWQAALARVNPLLAAMRSGRQPANG